MRGVRRDGGPGPRRLRADPRGLPRADDRAASARAAIAVGDRLTFIFENRDTVLFQIQEMLRAERAVKEEKILDEIAVYNELVPGAERALGDADDRDPRDRSGSASELDRLIGIDEHVCLDVGDRERARQRSTRSSSSRDRISAVQYVRFPLGPELAREFCDPAVPARLRVEHPNYRASAEISGASRASLIADLEAP